MRVTSLLLGTALGAVLLPFSVGAAAYAVPAAQDEGTVQIMAGSCSAPNFCLFDLVNYNAGSTTGTNLWRDIVHDDNDFDNHWRNGNGDLTSINMDNDTTSVKNRAGCFVYLYSGLNYTGDATRFSNGADDASLADNAVGNNAASSADFSC
ncbi:peptidase inhibitor family I36 protein [Streptomyces sp. NPDC055025]